jgi:hypothetical protein
VQSFVGFARTCTEGRSDSLRKELLRGEGDSRRLEPIKSQFLGRICLENDWMVPNWAGAGEIEPLSLATISALSSGYPTGFAYLRAGCVDVSKNTLEDML